MSFVRVGDTAAYDPRTLHPLEYDDGDLRHVNEVFGFSVRLAGESGGKEHEDTDRRVTRSMVLQMAGSPQYMTWLMDRLVAAKVWEPDGTGWRLINDPNYIHLLWQDEIDRNRIRNRDAKNPRLVAMALLRDGDNCRSCGRRVNWADRKSPVGGTWEHVNITNQPTQADEYVVYCFGCQNDPMSELMPPPRDPYYGPKTRDRVKSLLGKWPTKATIAEYVHGQRTLPGAATSRQRTETENAATGQRPASENATAGQRPGTENAAPAPAQRPEDASENADGQAPPDPPPKAPDGGSSEDQMIRGLSDLDRPGRDGTGSASPGHASTGGDGPAPGRPPQKKRSRRSKPTPRGGES